MLKKHILILSILFFISLISLIFGNPANQISFNPINFTSSTNLITFNETLNNASLSAWNETFVGNKTFWIVLPKNANVTEAKLKLSGYALLSDNITQTTVETNADVPIPTYSAQTFTVFDYYMLYSVSFYHLKVGSPTFNISIGIYNSSGSLLNSTIINVSTIPNEWNEIKLSYLLSPGWYYIEIKNSTYGTDAILLFGGISSDNYIHGSAWCSHGAYCIKEGVPTDNNTYFVEGLVIKDFAFKINTSRSASKNPYLDVANSEQPWEWSFAGDFNESVSPQVVDLNKTLINEWLKTCTPDSNNNCFLPIKLHSDNAGKIQISDINITYYYNSSELYNAQIISNRKFNITSSGKLSPLNLSFPGFYIKNTSTSCLINGVSYPILNDEKGYYCAYSLNVNKGSYFPNIFVMAGSPYWLNNNSFYNIQNWDDKVVLNITLNDSDEYDIANVKLESNYSTVPTNYSMNFIQPIAGNKGVYSYNDTFPTGVSYWKVYFSSNDNTWNITPTFYVNVPKTYLNITRPTVYYNLEKDVHEPIIAGISNITRTFNLNTSSQSFPATISLDGYLLPFDGIAPVSCEVNGTLYTPSVVGSYIRCPYSETIMKGTKYANRTIRWHKEVLVTKSQTKHSFYDNKLLVDNTHSAYFDLTVKNLDSVGWSNVTIIADLPYPEIYSNTTPYTFIRDLTAGQTVNYNINISGKPVIESSYSLVRLPAGEYTNYVYTGIVTVRDGNASDYEIDYAIPISRFEDWDKRDPTFDSFEINGKITGFTARVDPTNTTLWINVSTSFGSSSLPLGDNKVKYSYYVRTTAPTGGGGAAPLGEFRVKPLSILINLYDLCNSTTLELEWTGISKYKVRINVSEEIAPFVEIPQVVEVEQYKITKVPIKVCIPKALAQIPVITKGWSGTIELTLKTEVSTETKKIPVEIRRWQVITPPTPTPIPPKIEVPAWKIVVVGFLVILIVGLIWWW